MTAPENVQPSDPPAPGRDEATAPAVPAGSVGVLLVSHDGASWLPAVLDGLAAQTHTPTHVVAVDTGSKDDSARLATAALGASAVVAAPLNTSYPDAVRLGLDALPATEWVWLLHDDSNPDPGALAALLAAAAARPDVDILGPKLREWPSLRRLLELGVTISGTGRRETGLERGEYDQGQHDDVREVLAVNTAGMLVRRSVLDELGGFDERLPIFGNDIDFGWRAARAGHRTLIVPQAVVFHVEAAHRGIRKTSLTGRHTHLAERTAALHTLLANSPGRLLPFQAIRLFFGSMLRVLGFLLVRSPGEAVDELAAVLSVFLRPGAVIAARRARSPLAENDDRVRGLLAPRWLPYRHGLDAVGDVAAAATNQAADVAERRRAARMLERGETPSRPVTEEDALSEESSLLTRLVTSPVALVMTAFVLFACWLGLRALGTDAISGPGLSPAPDATGDWWRLHVQSWHPLGQGSDVAAPAYLLPLIGLSGLLFGNPDLAVRLLLMAAVPVAAWGAWRLLRVTGRLADPRGLPRWILIWGAITYALVPVVSGGLGQGWLGTVVAAALLPWLLHAALGFADPMPDRRWRAAWRSAAWLALISAFAPAAWWWALLVTLGLVVAGVVFARGLISDRSIWLPLVTPVLTVPVLLLPWFLPMVLQGEWSALVSEAGREPGPRADGLDLLAGRLDGVAAPHWIGLLLLVLALLVIAVPRNRTAVTLAWGGAAAAALIALVLNAAPGFTVVAVSMAAVLAVALGLQPAWRGWGGRTGQLIGVVALAVAALVPAAGIGWAAVDGQGELVGDADPGVPAYMVQTSATAPEHGILVVSGALESGLDYRVVRNGGVTLGEDEILARTAADPDVGDTLTTLIAQPNPDVVSDLADLGIEYLVLDSPADSRIAAGFDATSGLEQASAEDPQMRAWHVAPTANAPFLDGHGSGWRWFLVIAQLLAIVSVAVLCGPTRSESR